MINDPNCVARSMKRWNYEEIAAQIKHIWVLGRESAVSRQAAAKAGSLKEWERACNRS